MYQNHYYVDLLVKERHRELLAQARIVSQLRVNNASRRVNIDLGAIYMRLKAVIMPSRIEAQPVMPLDECVPAAECQAG